ncbi:hypothetical protein BDF14DRAFT_1826313 [Spinellus fusiger]|nr:hypothetical protein BDF14DRAFT_1826313 [Spinellus fusiger]
MLSNVRARIEAHRVQSADGGSSQSHSDASHSTLLSTSSQSSAPSITGTRMTRTRSAQSCLEDTMATARLNKNERPFRPRSGTTGSVHAIPLSALQFKHRPLATQWEDEEEETPAWKRKSFAIPRDSAHDNHTHLARMERQSSSDMEKDRLNSSHWTDLFADIVPPHTQALEAAHLVRDRLDAQALRIQRLDRSSHESTLETLMDTYPTLMAQYRQQVLQEEFQSQKQLLLAHQERAFELVKLKYRQRFDLMVDKLLRDPQRLLAQLLAERQEEERHVEERWKTQIAAMEER